MQKKILFVIATFFIFFIIFGIGITAFSEDKEKPDLVIKNIKLEKTTIGADELPSYRYIVYVKNKGKTAAEKSRLRVVISPSQPQAININNGKYYSCTQHATYPIPAQYPVNGDFLEPKQLEIASDYFNPVEFEKVTITATADFLNDINESDENNNIYSKTFYVKPLISLEECPNRCEYNTCY